MLPGIFVILLHYNLKLWCTLYTFCYGYYFRNMAFPPSLSFPMGPTWWTVGLPTQKPWRRAEMPCWRNSWDVKHWESHSTIFTLVCVCVRAHVCVRERGSKHVVGHACVQYKVFDIVVCAVLGTYFRCPLTIMFFWFVYICASVWVWCVRNTVFFMFIYFIYYFWDFYAYILVIL